MTPWRGVWVAIGAVVCVAAAPVDSTRRLTLRDALELTARRHVDVIVANERVQQAIARLQQAGSVLLPHVSASASESRQTKNLAALGIAPSTGNRLVGPFNTFDARVKLTQTVLDASALERLRAARFSRQLSAAQQRKAKQDTLALVASMYLDARRAAERIETAHAAYERQRAAWAVARARAEMGTGSSTELAQAEGDVAQARVRWLDASTQATERRLDLAAALGLTRTQRLVFDDEPLATIAARPSGVHPDIEAAQWLVKERRAERAAELAGFLPTVSLSADYGLSGNKPSDSEDTYDFGAQVSVPLFEGGLHTAKYREASSRVRESQAQLDDAQQHLDARLAGAREVVEQARASIDAATTELDARVRQWRLARERATIGTGSELDVADALAQATQARDDQLEAEATYELAQVRLAQAVGDVDALLASRPETQP